MQISVTRDEPVLPFQTDQTSEFDRADDIWNAHLFQKIILQKLRYPCVLDHIINLNKQESNQIGKMK